MQGKQGERTLAPIQGFTLGVVGLAAALMLAGCGTSGSAGALDTNDAGPNSVSGEASESATPAPDVESTEGQAERGSRTYSAQQRDTRVISAERIRVVNETIQRDAAAVGLGTVHKIRVESEAPGVSVALLRVTRNGSPQTLAATVSKVEGAWFVANVETMPHAQDFQW